MLFSSTSRVAAEAELGTAGRREAACTPSTHGRHRRDPSEGAAPQPRRRPPLPPRWIHPQTKPNKKNNTPKVGDFLLRRITPVMGPLACPPRCESGFHSTEISAGNQS